MINYETRQAIITQALNEIQFARNFKQGKTRNWKINEDLYYSRKKAPEYSRANVDLGQMQSHVHTILSKIDNPLVFKFGKRKKAQLARVNRLNALRVYDQGRDDWDIKDITGKKQCVIYGRTIYSYYADSYDGYCAHLDNIDVYDFLVDPSAGGIDLEKASYLGDYGVVLSREELKEGIKSGEYLRTETNTLLQGSGNATEQTTEVTNANNRTQDQNVTVTTKEIGDPDKYKFWRWGTTYKGQRYYMLLTDRGATAIKIQPIEEVFKSRLWWYWTYAAFPDLTEFWTPSFCDYVREIFMAQAVSINQMLDNAEQINKPQKVVQTGAVENLAQLKYRREGYILVKKDIDATKAIQELRPASINTPISVFNLLDGIQQRNSGVTAATQGDASNTGGDKVAIYKGNQENSADRFGYFNKSYSFGYKRFAKLFEWGVREHLTKKVAVDILGPDGVETEEISSRDIFWKNDQFNVMVESSNAELALSENDKKTKIAFLAGHAKDPTQNQKKAYELEATIAGFDEDMIRQLQDTSEFGDEELMAEADRDIEMILDGKKVKPNQAANTAYKQRFVTYMQNNQEHISMDQFKMLVSYVMLLDPIIIRNMVRLANTALLKAKATAEVTAETAAVTPPMQTPPITPGAPVAAPALLNNMQTPNGI